ncbi:hypothetical protein Tco_0135074 [Tanacetum coccineum]
MKDDYSNSSFQHQRMVNPKIHEVIKKEVIKLLDAGLIYPISDSPWVSPVHCMPKKGRMTLIENKDNELIPTRLVTGWRVCIDYRKLNDATRKDHFLLPFMDQMLERLAGNEYYCFLDAGNLFAYDPNPNSFNDSQNLSDYPPQPQYQTYSCELCGNDAHYGYDYDDEYTIQYREYLENSSNEITPVLPIKEPDNSLSMGDEHLSTILEMESDEVTKSSVEDLVPIPSESEGISNDTCDVPFCDNSPHLDVLNDHFEIFSDFNNDCTSSNDDSFEYIDYVEVSPPDSELVSLEEVKDDILYEKLLNINLFIACDLPSSDDFSPISIFEEKAVTFSNPLFDSNDDFTSSDDESLSDEDEPKDNFKIYSNPLFKFDDEYISSDVNPLFDKVLEDIECKDSYDSNLDESTFLVTPLSDSNEDECLAPSDDIKLFIHHDPSINVVFILEGFTDEPPLEENDDLFDLEYKEND